MIFCHHCKRLVEAGPIVGRRDDCPQCSWDLHVCLNCVHYDVHAYNECHEPQAERVLDKEKSNFCDFFKPRMTLSSGGEKTKEDDVKAKLEALFKKK